MKKQCANCGHTINENDAICPVCGKDRDSEGYKHPQKNKFIALIGIVVFASLAFYLVSQIVSFVEEANKPKEFKDLTNKEMQQFLEWDANEQQKKHENEKFFK
ncbi:hypothetical protein [Paenibacillus elgii]|uniref:hypothetical protein n=1 Tax=Paenibacillus elgii TaxID=189691 RepID=UPI00203AC009|nr:hypothetical protein [Paenibacillus elgii]MCM3273897.1 hypothetical protein [Paenibacillus elgii]